MEIFMKDIIFYSIYVSFISFGIIETITQLFNKTKLNKFLSLGIVYFIGLIFSFSFIPNTFFYQKLIEGIGIGSVSVAVYKSAIQSLLNLIPSLVDKIMGTSSNTVISKIETTEGDDQV